MKIIYNNFIPFKGFKCVNIFGILFVRNGTRPLSNELINHESIHTAQMKELLYILFYVIYFAEWLFRVLFTKDAFSHNAYKHVSFEKEAYKHENNLDYLKTRKHYAQWRK